MISVIVPAYGVEPYLRRALDSRPVADDIEVIVIDDGSRVSPMNGLMQYGDEIIYVRQKNGGLSVARNKGIEMAQGT